MSTRRDTPLRAERDETIVDVDGEKIALAYDPDGEVWYVRTSSVPGLEAAAGERDELIEALPLLIRRAALP